MVEQAGSNYPAMKPGVKLLWLSALLSGDYEQTTERLRDDNGYCCLGVLCDITPGGRWNKPAWNRAIKFNNREGMPNPGVYRYTGLSGEAAKQLSALNDGDGLSFEEIAEWIDANL